MKPSYRTKASYYEKEKEEYNALRAASGKISHWMLNQLAKISDEKKVPVSMLVSRAIYNEFFQSENPFETIIDLQKVTDEKNYPNENSQKLYAYITAHPNLSLEHLIICKEDIEIKNVPDLIGAYEHLLAFDLIKEEYPERSKFKKYPRDSYRIVHATKKKLSIAEQRELYNRPVAGMPSMTPGTGPLDEV